MAKLYVMIGIPGSGKTTFVKKFVKNHDCVVVSTDIIRQNNPGILEEKVWPTVYQKIGSELLNGVNVVFDATSISKKVRDRLKENVNQYCTDYELVGYFFPTHYSICCKRVEKRNQDKNELYLPVDVIKSYGENVYPPTYEEGFSESNVVSYVPELLKNLVFDAYQGYALYIRYKENDEYKYIEEYSGFADTDTFEPVRANTCFRLASVSKQFIAYGILSLVKDKLLDLNETLFNIFDDMPLYCKDIKITNLLNHTSGLIDYESMEHTDKQVSDYDVLDFIRTTKNTYFEIGSKYQYSNTAYVILGLIIEKVSKIKLGDYLQEKVFKKAKMENTCADYEGVTVIKPRAYGNIVKNKRLVKKDQYWCSATIGDGGIYSNINDLKKWVNFIENINEEPFSLMKKTNICHDIDIQYGYGLRVKEINNHELIYHCGDTIGTNTLIGFVKDYGLQFIFLTNRQGIDTAIFIENLRKCLKKWK